MAQLKVPVDDFHLTSKYTCTTNAVIVYGDTSHSTIVQQGTSTSTSDPELATTSKTIAFDLPNGSTVTGARLLIERMPSTYGTTKSTINGVEVGTPDNLEVDIPVIDGDTSVTIKFGFITNVVEHDHYNNGDGTLINSYWSTNNRILTGVYTKEHSGVLSYRGVCLLIDYRPAVEFTGWTDDPLTAGETLVKAVHLTEMQEWVALLSEYADNGTPTFTAAVPGETSLALWLSQVEEIRSVLDVICPTHEDWIDVSVNCPRADVMTQLRSIIVSAM